jgi:hypothetical protein
MHEELKKLLSLPREGDRLARSEGFSAQDSGSINRPTRPNPARQHEEENTQFTQAETLQA